MCFVLLILSLFISSLFCFLVSGFRASYCRFLSCFLTCPSFFMFFLLPNVCVTGCGTGPPCINVCIHLLYLVYSHTYIFEMYAYIHEYGCGAHVYTYNMYAYIHSCISPQHSVQHRFTAIRNGSHVFQIEFSKETHHRHRQQLILNLTGNQFSLFHINSPKETTRKRDEKGGETKRQKRLTRLGRRPPQS